jgi:hypothetical protein
VRNGREDNLSEFTEPVVQTLAWRHEFGKDRYVNLMVAGVPGNFHGTLFGTEQPKQINEGCKSAEDCCARIEEHFRELFPDHICNQGCFAKWQDFFGSLLSG